MAERSRRSKQPSKSSPQKKDVPEFLRKHIRKNREKDRQEDEAYLEHIKKKKAKSESLQRSLVELVKVRMMMRDYTLKMSHVKSELDRVRNHLQIVKALKAQRNGLNNDVAVVIRTTSPPVLTYSGAIVTAHENSSQFPTFNSIDNISALDLRHTSSRSTIFENALICCAEIPADSDEILPVPIHRMADNAFVRSHQLSTNTVLTTAVAQLISSTGLNQSTIMDRGRVNYQEYDAEMSSTMSFSDQVLYPTMQHHTQVNYPRSDYNFEQKIREIMLSSP